MCDRGWGGGDMRIKEPNVIDEHRYSLKETAYYLGVSRQTLYRWQRRGLLNVERYKVNGNVFVTGKEIKRVWRETE